MWNLAETEIVFSIQFISVNSTSQQFNDQLKRQRLSGIPGGAAFNYNPVGNRYLGISRTRTLAGAWAALRVISNLYL